MHCPNINVNESDKVVFEPNETKMNTIVKFSCEVGYSLVGASEIKCLPSGNWSAPFPRCEGKSSPARRGVQCREVIMNDTDLMNDSTSFSLD